MIFDLLRHIQLLTYIYPICSNKNKLYSTLASSLKTNTAYILENNSLTSLALILVYSYETDAVSILENNALSHLDSTLVPGLDSIPSLLPFPNTSLPLYFQYLTGVNFTYHPLMYDNHFEWIEAIIPILQLLISSFHLKYIFLFKKSIAILIIIVFL